MTFRFVHRAYPRIELLLFIVALLGAPGVEAACSVSAASANLGSYTSLALESAPTGDTQTASGLACDPGLIGIGTPAHIKALIESGLPGGSGVLTGPDGITVSFRLATSAGGTPLGNGDEVVFVSQTALISALLGLFSGPNSSIPMYVRAGPGSALKAGVYTGVVAVRWYYYTCSGIGALGICLGQSSSPGFTVNLLTGQVTNWGSGQATLINISLIVTADCLIDAPDIDFGSAPLVSVFNPVTQTINVRCTRDQAYQVGLTDGLHALNGQRLLQGGSGSLAYEIYKSGTTARWGGLGGERRSNTDADVNAGTPDGTSSQGFVYRAEISASQPTPPPGMYVDSVQVTVEF